MPRTSDEKPTRKPSAFVYFIQCGEQDGPIKIGQALDVEHRLETLQVGCPYVLTLLAFFPSDDPDWDESQLHRQFRAYRMRGEWFAITADLKQAIEAVPARGGRIVADLTAPRELVFRGRARRWSSI